MWEKCTLEHHVEVASRMYLTLKKMDYPHSPIRFLMATADPAPYCSGDNYDNGPKTSENNSKGKKRGCSAVMSWC
jgi:hypothetical protein